MENRFRDTESLEAYKQRTGIKDLTLYEGKNDPNSITFDYTDKDGNLWRNGYLAKNLDRSKPMFVSIVTTDIVDEVSGEVVEIPTIHNANKERKIVGTL